MVYLQFTKIPSPKLTGPSDEYNKNINTNDFSRNTNKLHLIEDDKNVSEPKFYAHSLISPHCETSSTI